MLILAVFLYFAFHAFTFKWFANNLVREVLDRPMIFLRRWFTPAALSVSGGLFLSSVVCFWASSPWLALVPFFMLLISVHMVRLDRGTKLRKAVEIAARCHAEMSKGDRNQSEINGTILRRLFGESEQLSWGAEVDTKTFLKCAVLPRMGLYRLQDDMDQMLRDSDSPTTGDKIEAMFDSYVHLVSAQPDAPS